jgi:hypothetical protein
MGREADVVRLAWGSGGTAMSASRGTPRHTARQCFPGSPRYVRRRVLEWVTP